MLIKKLYESYALEKISEKRFESLRAAYEQEQAELDAYKTDSTNAEAFIKLAKKYREFPELTPAMINEFVDKIIVHAPIKAAWSGRSKWTST